MCFHFSGPPKGNFPVNLRLCNQTLPPIHVQLRMQATRNRRVVKCVGGPQICFARVGCHTLIRLVEEKAIK